MTMLKRLLASLLLIPGVALAVYPERPITMLIAYPPGGGTDLVGRALGPFIEKYLGGGARIVVVNRAGAGGEVGFAALANAAPDGYTIGTTGIGSDDHIAMLKFERAAGVKMRHVPFKGSADVRAAIAGRQIDVAAINIGEALQYQKGGTPLRNLVQMSPARTNL